MMKVRLMFMMCANDENALMLRVRANVENAVMFMMCANHGKVTMLP